MAPGYTRTVRDSEGVDWQEYVEFTKDYSEKPQKKSKTVSSAPKRPVAIEALEDVFDTPETAAWPLDEDGNYKEEQEELVILASVKYKGTTYELHSDDNQWYTSQGKQAENPLVARKLNSEKLSQEIAIKAAEKKTQRFKSQSAKCAKLFDN